MDTTRSRFGIALAVSSLVIGFVGFAVYVDRPETPIKPVLIHRHASAFEISAAGAQNDGRYGQAREVLAQFISALSDDDDKERKGVEGTQGPPRVPGRGEGTERRPPATGDRGGKAAATPERSPSSPDAPRDRGAEP